MGARARRGWLGSWLAVGALLLGPAPGAGAFEFLDGNLEVHGFFENQIRVLGRDLDTGDGLDLAQWYHVLNLEIEWAIAPDGWGPFDLVSSYARIETRYDCVWTRGCGLFPSADTYGDRAGHLPSRVSDAHRAGFTGATFTGDLRHRHGIPAIPLDPVTGLPDPDGASSLEYHFFSFPLPGNPRRPAGFFNTPTIDDLFNVEGPDEKYGTADDPAAFTFSPVLGDCKYAYRKVRGPENGIGTQSQVWNPGCYVRSRGTLRDKPNPFSPLDVNPVLSLTPGPDGIPGTGDEPTTIVGSGALPYRPAPLNAAGSGAPGSQAQGIYYPNASVARLVRQGRFHRPDQNFSQDELAWNYGASQQNERNLKELYLDLELLDSRLWIRAGKQNIVWGKTELFRTTDQFNPQDIALATLPDLEESRIALWSVRGVYSFYELGPLSDFRVELAFNYDQVEPTDIGRCGEPFAPNPVCNKTFGLLAHGLTGEALAGELRPPDPWDSTSGIEIGGRIEFRWDRFSFQIMDFYGYDDFAYVDDVFRYSRNVDPETGRPRRLEDTGACTTGAEPACLQGGVDALLNHSVNQQLFAMVCATSIGFSGLDRSVCAQSVLNSQADTALPGVTVTEAVGSILSFQQGGVASGQVVFVGLSNFLPGTGNTFLDLNADGAVNIFDLPLVTLTDDAGMPVTTPNSLATALSPEQQALIGCGPFYGTSCVTDGVDLLNAEATAVTMSWPGIEGTFGDWDVTDGSIPQPGTLDFVLANQSPVCTRYEGGRVVMLPGCRGPGFDAASLGFVTDGVYDATVDGIPPNSSANGGFLGRHPFACTSKDAMGNVLDRASCQPWASEMAAFSWNALAAFVALSGLGEDPTVLTQRVDFFDPTNPLGVIDPTDPTSGAVKCGLRKPQLCSNVQAIYLITGLQRNITRAGGNGRFGRRDFIWHGGTSSVLRYDRRNVLGFSFDFAEDRTKSNWSVETTWIAGSPEENHDEVDGLTTVDTYNLTISVDRPTFINFLNPNRTFFFNSQWFFQYVDGYEDGFPANGPLNVLATFTVETGMFDDRLMPRLTLVYDFNSGSGGGLPQIRYRFTSNFDATFGMNFFWGREERTRMELTPVVIENRAGRDAYRDFTENGLSAVRDRDEIYLRIRYTF